MNGKNHANQLKNGEPMNAILSDLSDKQHEDNQATAAEVLAGIPRIYEQLAAAQDHLAAAMRSRQQTNDAMNRADWSQDRTMCDLIFIDLNRLVA